MSAPYYSAIVYNETTTQYKLRIFASYADLQNYIRVQEAHILDDYELTSVHCNTHIPPIRPNGIAVKGNVGLLDNSIQIVAKLFAQNTIPLYSAAIVENDTVQMVSFQDDFYQFLVEICRNVEGIMPQKIQQQVQQWNQSQKKHGTINIAIGDFQQTLVLCKTHV